MELKDYQQGVLRKLDHYLATLAEKHDDARAFVEFQRGRGKKVALPDYCRDAWDALNQEGRLPWLRDRNGDTLVAAWLSRHDGLQRGILNICLKVPTGGGKTLLATVSLERIQTDYFKRQTGLVLWVVPSDAIYRQTWKQLANREHPYRQMLERASGGRVKLLEKTDAFTRRDVADQLCIMLLMLPSAERKSKETLRLFRDSGRFVSFFPPEDDSTANRALLDTVPNLDLNDLADTGFAEGIVPGSLSIRQSLGNVLRLLRPVVVIDEGHKAYSDPARDTLCGFNPRFVLELSATPNAGGKHQSNVLVNVPDTDLKDEAMIKLPINVVNEDRELYRQNGDPLRKSLFEKVYQHDLNSLEKHTAWYLDASDSVYWWHRIAVGTYGLQGWQRQRVYPDLLACVHGTENGTFRFSVLETKPGRRAGEHLKGNDETEYKCRLFELLTRHADTAVRAGALELDADLSTQGITFTLLMEDSWKQELAAAGIGYRPPGN